MRYTRRSRCVVNLPLLKILCFLGCAADLCEVYGHYLTLVADCFCDSGDNRVAYPGFRHWTSIRFEPDLPSSSTSCARPRPQWLKCETATRLCQFGLDTEHDNGDRRVDGLPTHTAVIPRKPAPASLCGGLKPFTARAAVCYTAVTSPETVCAAALSGNTVVARAASGSRR
jgi:hypothetical protein